MPQRRSPSSIPPEAKKSLLDRFAFKFREEALRVLYTSNDDRPSHLELPDDIAEVHVSLKISDWDALKKTDLDLIIETLNLEPNNVMFAPRDGKHPLNKVIIKCSRDDLESLFSGPSLEETAEFDADDSPIGPSSVRPDDMRNSIPPNAA